MAITPTAADFISTQYEDYDVFPKNAELNIRQQPGTDAKILSTIKSNQKAGVVLALYKNKVNNYNWYYILLNNPVENIKYGFVAIEVSTFKKGTATTTTTTNTTSTANTSNNTNTSTNTASTSNTSTSTDDETKRIVAEKLIKGVADRDVIIYKRILVIYYQLVRLQSIGQNVDRQMTVLKNLALRYVDRQNKLQQVKDAEKQGTINFGPVNVDTFVIYDKVKNYLGLGLIQIPVAILIGVVAVVSIGVTLWIINLLKPAYDKQAEDLKITGEFKTWFDKIPDEKAKTAIKAELGKQIDDAYNAGKSSGSWGSTFTWIKTGAIVFASIWAGTKLLDMGQKWRSNKNDGSAKD